MNWLKLTCLHLIKNQTTTGNSPSELPKRQETPEINEFWQSQEILPWKLYLKGLGRSNVRTVCYKNIKNIRFTMEAISSFILIYWSRYRQIIF